MHLGNRGFDFVARLRFGLTFGVDFGGSIRRIGLLWPSSRSLGRCAELGRCFPGGGCLAAQLIGNITLTESWRFHISGLDRVRYILGPAWTLCFEEQFYAVAGLMMLFGMRRYFQSAILVSAATAAICFAASYFNWRIDGFFFDGRWLLFAEGILVYFAVNYASQTLRRVIKSLSVIALAAAIAVAVRQGWISFDPNAYAVGSVFAVIILLAHPWDRQTFAAPVLRPLRFCGAICYSLYLIHVPVVMVCTHILLQFVDNTAANVGLIILPACFAGAILAAWIFHLLVERRFMNSRLPTPTNLTPNARIGDGVQQGAAAIAEPVL